MELTKEWLQKELAGVQAGLADLKAGIMYDAGRKIGNAEGVASCLQQLVAAAAKEETPLAPEAPKLAE